jgi:TRAP-type C4-dicarboxylate transport system permease large subunit
MAQVMRHLWPFIVFGFGLLAACILYPPLVTTLPRALGY